MKKVVLTTLSIVTLIVGCKKAIEPEIQNQDCNSESVVQRANYPISIGSYWVYDTYKVIDSSGVENVIRTSDTTRVIGDTTLNGEVYSIFRGLRYPMSSQKYNWYLRDSLEHIVDYYQGVSYGTWNVSNSINYYEDNSYAQWGSFLDVEEPVSVDAGIFLTKRLRIHFMYTDGSPISQCLNDSISNNAGAEFYAENVGLVQKNVTYSSQINCEHFESRLKDYYIAP